MDRVSDRRTIFAAIVLCALTVSTSASAITTQEIGTHGPYDVTIYNPVKYASPSDDSVIECKPTARGGHFAGRLPAVLLIHGGAWSGGTNAVGPDYTGYSGSWCGLWASWGFVAFSVGYRLTGTAAWPAQIIDVQAAIRWIRANAARLGVNPGLIVADGDSAGGQLAMIAGYSWTNIPGDLASNNAGASPQAQVVVSQFGPWTFGPGSDPSSRAEDYAAQMLLDVADKRTTANTAATMFIQGTEDTTVNQCSQSEPAYRFLRSNNRPAVYVPYDGAHEFTDMDANTWATVVGAIQVQSISYAYAKAHSAGILPASEKGPGTNFSSGVLPSGCP